MIQMEVNEELILKQKKALEDALASNPKTAAKLRKMIREVILEERKKLVSSTEGAARMKSDPRGAAQSVRTSVYKRILGANINIYSSRRSGRPSAYQPEHHPSKVGGNRRSVSYNTQRINSYGPHDRGFILRFLNVGINMNRQTRYGNRGGIPARNWFERTAEPLMEQAVEKLSEMIDQELDKK
jgi:hypothetical protein